MGENEEVEAKSEKPLFQEKKGGGEDQWLEVKCRATRGCFLFFLFLGWV